MGDISSFSLFQGTKACFRRCGVRVRGHHCQQIGHLRSACGWTEEMNDYLRVSICGHHSLQARKINMFAVVSVRSAEQGKWVAQISWNVRSSMGCTSFSTVTTVASKNTLSLSNPSRHPDALLYTSPASIIIPHHHEICVWSRLRWFVFAKCGQITRRNYGCGDFSISRDTNNYHPNSKAEPGFC